MGDKMDKIECLLCGGTVKIPTNTDTEQYDGLGVCKKCKSLIHVKLAKGKVQKYKVVENKSNQAWQYNITVPSEEGKKNLERVINGEGT